MNHITGTPREQITMFPDAIDDYITEENPVRFLDAFVDSLDTGALGFEHATVSDTGRPPYHPKDLLKLYLYGYLNRVRSSRLLERETSRNIEVLWLVKRLSPDHKTISDFRRNNPDALRAVFKAFIKTCKELELFSNELVAVDSTKFKAQNARDRVKDAEGLDKSIARLTESITAYLQQLDNNDAADDAAEDHSTPLTKQQLQEKIALLQQKKADLEKAKTELESSGDRYISLIDPDCRLMKNHGVIQPAYTMQAAVDAKHGLIVDYEVTQDAADNNHLASMASAAKATLGVDTLTVCADAGYYDTVDLQACEEQQITTYVPIPAPKVSKKTGVPAPEYYHDKFTYDATTDTYHCPQGHTLQYYRNTHKEDGRCIRIYRIPQTGTCTSCPVRAQCTTSPRGRYIYRWEHEDILERLKERLHTHPELTQLRKSIVEHPFGTLKSVWGYGHFLLKRLKNVSAEATLMTLAYNIRRTLTIIGTTGLIAHIQSGETMI